MFKPLDQMWARAANSRADSDIAYFYDLMFLGEALTKTVTAALVAAVQDDRDRHRYQHEYRLFRASGLGDWQTSLDEILTGPAAQHLLPGARDLQRELTQRLDATSWQYQAVEALSACLHVFGVGDGSITGKQALRQWFSLFPELRNKTRGHGAPHGVNCSKACEPLERSLTSICSNLCLFQYPWAYLHRNLSGKYRVTPISADVQPFEPLKSSRDFSFPSGIYVYFDKTVEVTLISSDVEASDFYYPNGGFRKSRFEWFSYYSDSRADGDASNYLVPASSLPPSETEGLKELGTIGQAFSNIPQVPTGYVTRRGLEDRLFRVLKDDRHPLVTLAGKGGTGKTWLALSVLRALAELDRFFAILWFSARDIDLLPQGPKLVAPHILTDHDIAIEFTRLVEPSALREKDFRPLEYFATALRNQLVKEPILFVLDNFETVRDPEELFGWVDQNLRLPNKVLITTRHRDFTGDYCVDVGGMTESEALELIRSTAASLGIKNLLTSDFCSELVRESGGHPYVLKILLGELAKEGSTAKIQRLVASKPEILQALFERTYAALSPVARRVFLTLCAWRSAVPEVGIEAVLLRPDIHERIDVESALDELRRLSFVESSQSQADDSVFVTVPLAAREFGLGKLKASPLRYEIESDRELLRAFGAAQTSDVVHGIGPRVQRLIAFVAERAAQDKSSLEHLLPILNFVGRRFPRTYLALADMYSESADSAGLDKATMEVERFLELASTVPERVEACRRLAELNRMRQDFYGEIRALVDLASLSEVPFREVSDAANRVNFIFRDKGLAIDTSEKRAIFRRLAEVMAARIRNEGDADDCSRLGWLYCHLRDKASAMSYADLGLQLDPSNDHCQRLRRRLG